MWLLYISCAWVAGIFLGSKVGLPLVALSLGLLPFLFIPLFHDSKKTLTSMTKPRFVVTLPPVFG